MGVSTSVPFVASGKRSVTDSDDVECERKRRKTGGSTNTGKGKGKEVDLTSQDVIPPVLQSPSQPDPLSSYCCPICFSPPTNATLTPCGHICCGSCLFTAVKSMVERGQLLMPGEQALARWVEFSVVNVCIAEAASVNYLLSVVQFDDRAGPRRLLSI
jgi:hypothetical protein